MQPDEIEERVDQILTTIAAGGKVNVEDDHIELKRQWPSDPARAARQIAGLANAADGWPALWLIGIDEKKGVTPVKAEELANWWPRVEACFSTETRLKPKTHVIPRNEGSVVALVFETADAPFLVTKNDRNEVPWRTANGTRSATRSDILRILSAKPPTIELLEASLAARTNRSGHDLWRFKAHALITTPGGQGEVIILSRGSRIRIEHGHGMDELVNMTFDIGGAEHPDQVRVDKAEHVRLTALGSRTVLTPPPPFVRLTLTLQPAGGRQDVQITEELQKTSRTQSNELFRYERPLDL